MLRSFCSSADHPPPRALNSDTRSVASCPWSWSSMFLALSSFCSDVSTLTKVTSPTAYCCRAMSSEFTVAFNDACCASRRRWSDE